MGPVDYALSSMPEKTGVSGGGRVFWAVQGLLVGALALLSGISLKREAAIHSLNREVGELRGLLISLAEREGTVEQELERGRRDLSAGELPEMYDVSYFEARGKHMPLGIYGGGEVLGDRRPAGPSHQQGVNSHPGERYSASTAAPPQTSSPPRTYKKPELKSLGTPNQPTSPSTAIQLEAGDPTELRHDGLCTGELPGEGAPGGLHHRGERPAQGGVQREKGGGHADLLLHRRPSLPRAGGQGQPQGQQPSKQGRLWPWTHLLRHRQAHWRLDLRHQPHKFEFLNEAKLKSPVFFLSHEI